MPSNINGGGSLGGSGQPVESVAGAERPEPSLFTREDLESLRDANPDMVKVYNQLVAIQMTVAAAQMQLNALLDAIQGSIVRSGAVQGTNPTQQKKPEYATFGGT